MDGQGSPSAAYVHVDSFTAKGHGHLPDGAVVVPDPNLIFHGEFRRAGVDLVLSNDGHEFVVHDYFKGDKRAAIASPDGAHLTGDVVSALTGHVQYAQAAPGAASAEVIGHVTKLAGSATAVRNGVSIILNNGDNVEKGDVVSTGADSTLGVTFIDGTVFGLSSNARMVLNEMVYDPNGSSNSSLLSLVAGTITFVAGETAKHGDMKIDTPVATMGIRGTAVLTQINFVVPPGGGDPQPQASFQVLVEPNGTTGSYILFDKITLLPIATVNQAGQMIQISGGNVSVSNALLSPDVQKLITDVFTLKFTDNNTNTKQTTNFTDTITQTSDGLVIKTASGYVAIPTFVNLNQQGPTPQAPGDHTTSNNRIPGAPQSRSLDLNDNPATAFAVTERTGKTGDATDVDTVSGRITFLDFNLADQPTVKVDLAQAPNFVYQNAGHQDVTATLTALQKQDIAATQINISVVPDASNHNNGSAVWTYSVPDKLFDFLAAGETLTLTYIVRVDNNFAANNETAYIPITITITGTNDKPVITTSVPTITFDGGTSVEGGLLTSKVPTSGTLTFTDVDLTDTHTVSVSDFSAVLPGGTVPDAIFKFFKTAMSVSIAAGHDSTGTGTGAITWALGEIPVYLADFIPKDAVLTLTYTVKVTDSQGVSADQTITVTITGTDSPAVVWIATAENGAPLGGLWSDGTNWETGVAPTIDDDVIVITNQLIGLTPSYPVTIDVAAFAKSLTMNDYDITPLHKVPEVINKSTLTIAGALSLSADSKLTNFAAGIILVGGKAEILGTSVLANAGYLTLAGGGDFASGTSITNSGTIELSGTLTTLTTQADIHNAGGTLKVDAGATLIVDNATIDGGTVTIAGTLESIGTSAITNSDVTNTGTITVTSGTLTIDPAVLHTITNDSLIQAINGGTLKLSTMIVNNASTGVITVDGISKLYLSDVTINDGKLNNSGHLYSVSGSNKVTAAVTNTGTIEVQGDTLNLAGGLSGIGTLIIDNGAKLELAGADAETITFAGGTGTLQLDKVASQSFTGTIAGQTSADGAFAITGAADIKTSSGDALDFTASKGSHAGIVLTPTGALTGKANGIVVTQDGTGDISLTATGDITGLAGHGIWLSDSANGAGSITVKNLTGKATGTGAGSEGILVENLNAANSGDISITQLGGAAGGAYGIDATTQGNGKITIEAGGNITGASIYGIRARSYGSGSETITTDAGGVVTSGSSGIVAVNRAASLDASVGSTITVNAYGTIHSGAALNQSNTSPAGIQAGYTGANTGSVANTKVAGSVVVNNHADISAAGGYGIHAYNYGNGDVTVNDGAGTTIVGADEGIRAQALSGGTGNVSVSLHTNTSVTGTSGFGIYASSIDQGDITITLGAGATVTGGDDAIRANALGGVAGDISITLGSDVSVTSTTGYGIIAYSEDQGNISVAMAKGDNIDTSGSGSSGIVAVNYATAIDSSLHSKIDVEAHGAIHSGSTLNNDLTTPGAIIAGYKPGGNGTFNDAVTGDVTVTSDATIIADAGYGIEAFTWGAGDVTVTTGLDSSITAAGTAIAAFDHGGGDVSVTNEGGATGTVGLAALATGAGNVTITNDGHITSTSLAGISVTQNDAGAIGSTHITNSGSIVAPTGHAAIFIQENTHGAAVIDNSGTIGPAVGSTVTATTYAIVETGGAITINNTGHINGNISVASATFNNEAHGVWTVSGTSVFGTLSSISNAGEIDLHNGASISGADGTAFTIGNSGEIESWGAASITGSIINTNSIEVHTGTLTLFGSLSGSGSVKIDAGATLDVHGTVSQTVTFAGGGAELQIDTSDFGGSIAGFAATDKIDLSTIEYGLGTSAAYVSNAAHNGGVLTVTDADGHSISLTLVGDYSNAHFAGGTDGHGGTLITYSADDDQPTFTPSETSQSAGVAEQANLTGSSTSDQSTPATGTIHFTDVDLTDRPTAKISGQSVTWLDVDHTKELTLTSDEVTALESALTIQTTGKNNGAVGWSYSITDSALDFLGEGQTATVVSTITLDDHQGKTDTAQVTVTITGANDAPKIGYSLPNYLAFDGATAVSGAVSTQNTGNGSDGVSLQGWVNWSGKGNSGESQLVFYNGSTSDAGFGVNGVVTNDGKLDLQIQNGGIPGIDTGITIDANHAHNIALTHVNGLFTLYVDGVAEYTTTANVNGIPAGHADFTEIGGVPTEDGTGFATEGFRGSISDVSIWNTALTQAQVQANQTATLTGGESNLVGLFPLHDGSGATVTNLASGGGDLTIHGNAAWIGATSGGVSASVTETDAGQAVHGTLTVTDVDVTDHVTVALDHVSVYLDGHLQADGIDGLSNTDFLNYLTVQSGDILNGTATQAQFDWSFNSNGQAFDFLAAGQTLSLQYTIVPNDGHAATGTSNGVVTINIAGSNDAPVIDTENVSVTQTSDERVTVHGLSVTDVDAVADETFAITASTAVSGSNVTPSIGSGSLAGINSALQTITYSEGTAEPSTDTVALTVTDGHGATDTVNLIFNLAESANDRVSLNSTTGKDVLFGTGYEDRFVFSANSNHDTIVNFTSGQDQIDLSAVVTTDNASAWMAQHVTASPANSADTLITIDAADTIVLKGVSVGSLHASDFVVH
nr:LamG-like jellyroll fold domain-containing protein [Bradyrhizobium neotropicale]